MRTIVVIQDLQIYGYHGLCNEERSLGQKFVFNLRCKLADVRSHLGDRLENSVGYDVLTKEVASISESRKFHTLEALAETIARTLLIKHPYIEIIEVCARKFSPPMAHSIGSASVEVALIRDDLGRTD